MIRQSWRQLRPFLDGKSSYILGLSALAIVSGVAEATALLLAVRVAVGITANEKIVDISGYPLSVSECLTIAAGAEFLAFIGHAMIARFSARLSATVLRASRRLALRRYVRAPWSIQSVQREGALQDLVSTLTYRTSEVAQYLAYGLSQSIILMMFVGASLIVDWRFTSAIIGAGALVVLLLRPVARATQLKARDFVEANSHYAEEVGRLASASMELKSFGVEPIAERNLEHFNAAASRRHYEARFSGLFSGGVFKDVAVMLLIGSVAGLYWVGQDALANAGVVITLIIRGLASAQAASSSYQSLSEGAPNLAQLDERISAMVAEERPNGNERLAEFDYLNFANVSFEYRPGEGKALKNVNIRVDTGDFLGIVGPSGGGKSTLLQLLLRLRYPSEGTITFNGIDYRDISADDWHRFVSLVPQEPSLLEGTIAENIAYYRDIPQADIENAARSANIYDEVSALPEGFETKLGPRGSGLSGGQKQRIAIARALAGKPALLVMDEPTSALDTAAELAILETIGSLRGDTTIVLVAHRMSTVSQCDYLLEVTKGSVVRRSNTAYVAPKRQGTANR